MRGRDERLGFVAQSERVDALTGEGLILMQLGEATTREPGSVL